MFDYKYLSNEHLEGFDNYKYMAKDTSPLSVYVMHPFWNKVVEFFNSVQDKGSTFRFGSCIVKEKFSSFSQSPSLCCNPFSLIFYVRSK
ncbi:unnamed protein product [Parnassius apollo]|uniref:(apollo) hypothetical protein n=1 Tax=Parnassius apollo TaxID=110799 RepID=A0A8S3Y163_PARAO|nr:unnamed protein product [Parnassius apollo]